VIEVICGRAFLLVIFWDRFPRATPLSPPRLALPFSSLWWITGTISINYLGSTWVVDELIAHLHWGTWREVNHVLLLWTCRPLSPIWTFNSLIVLAIDSIIIVWSLDVKIGLHHNFARWGVNLIKPACIIAISASKLILNAHVWTRGRRRLRRVRPIRMLTHIILTDLNVVMRRSYLL
jgi:hypothetical protein